MSIVVSAVWHKVTFRRGEDVLEIPAWKYTVTEGRELRPGETFAFEVLWHHANTATEALKKTPWLKITKTSWPVTALCRFVVEAVEGVAE